MLQVKSNQRLLIITFLVMSLAPLSLFAEQRPDWRTMGAQSEVRRQGNRDLEGIVMSVNPNGDDFMLRTGRGTILIEAKGGVPAWFAGRRYRIRDLERGDRVAVDLISRSSRYYRARSVEVLDSVSHRGGRYDRNDPYYGPDRRYDSRGRYDARRGGYDTLFGHVISFDARRDLMVVRSGERRDVVVETGELDRNHGRQWARSIRIGDRIALEGRFRGRRFIAQWISPDQGRSYGRYDRP